MSCSAAPSQLDHLAAKATTALYTLADAAAATPEAATDAAKDNGGIFGPLANLFETILKVRSRTSQRSSNSSTSAVEYSYQVLSLLPCLQFLESGLDKVGTPYAYGFAIILLTVLVKAATFPLSQKSVSIRSRY